MRSCGRVVVCVVVWSCGRVVVWSCGHVVVWSCGRVVVWSRRDEQAGMSKLGAAFFSTLRRESADGPARIMAKMSECPDGQRAGVDHEGGSRLFALGAGFV